MGNETMVATSQAVNGSGNSIDRSSQLKVIRDLKNSVIGNRVKKLQSLHLLPELHSLAIATGDAELQVQAITAIGSLAYGVEDGVRAIVEHDGVNSLVHALTQNDQRVVVAAARSLKLVYQSPLAPREPLLQKTVLQRLISLVEQPPCPQVDEVAAHVLGFCCTNATQAEEIVGAGAVPALLQLLLSPVASTQEAAVGALKPITRFSLLACQQVLQSTAGTSSIVQQQQQSQQQYAPALQQILHLMKQHNSRMRFLSASCVSNMSRCSAVPADAVQLSFACHCALPYVVRLLTAAEAAANGSSVSNSAAKSSSGKAHNDDSRYLHQVPMVLAALIHDRPELLKVAVELDTIQTLIRLLHSKAATSATDASKEHQAAAQAGILTTSSTAAVPNFKSSAAAAKAARLAAAAHAAAAAAEDAIMLRMGCLLSLAALSLQGDGARQKMVDGGRLMSAVVSSLSDSSSGIRGAAAACLRGLTRSVKLLRGTAIPDTVAGPLVALLLDNEATDVQVAAAAAACNLVLGFSHVRPAMMTAGILPALKALLSSMVPELRLHAVWALKNLAQECEGEVQGLLLSELTWPGFKELLTADDDGRVREQATGLLQNLLSKGGQSVNQVMVWSEGELLHLLEERLDPRLYEGVLTAALSEGRSHQDLKAQLVGILYAVNNVCSGSEEHKAAVMGSKIPPILLQYLRDNCSTPAAETLATTAGGEGSSRTAGQQALCDVRIAAVWCVINLLWCTTPGEDGSTSAAQESTAAAAARAVALKELGYEGVLGGILAHCASSGNDAAASSGTGAPPLSGASGSQDLAERVQTALQLLQKLGSK